MELASGFINLNKPSGMSSAAAVSKIKRLTGFSCGHMGTLDPLASGVLPVALGNASRLFNYLLDKNKVYRAVFRFGVQTDTLDSTGTVLQDGMKTPSEKEIKGVLYDFVGEIEQMPPAYSAKSVNGVRAYQLARQGKEVVLQPKKVRIDSVELVGRVSDAEFEFTISCGGGTYIRSLARDIAARCGTGAIMTSLVREKSGFFELKNSVQLQELGDEGWREHLIPTDSVFEMPILRFEGTEAKKLLNGLCLPCLQADGEYKLYVEDAFYGIAQVLNGSVRTKVKLI